MVDLGGSIVSGLTGGATIAIVIKAVDQFSKTFNEASLGMKGLSAAAGIAVVGVTALAGAMVSVGKASLDASLQVQPIREGFQKLTKDSDKFLDTLNEVTKGTVSNFDLMSSSNKALLLGLDQEALPSLFKNAAIVGRAAGRSTTEAIEDITIGIGRQSKLILDNLGIIVNAEEAYDSYAKSIGKVSSQLTDAEKKTAFANAAITSLEQKAATLGGTLTEDATTSLAQFNKQWADTKVQVGDILLPILGNLLTQIQPLIPLVGEFLTKAFKDATDAVGPMVPDIIQLVKQGLILGTEVLPILIGAFQLLSPVLKIAMEILSTILDVLTAIANIIGKVVSGLARDLGGPAAKLISGAIQNQKARHVGDFILRPNGQLIETDPRDTIVGYKGSGGMGGGTVVVQGNLIGLNEEDIARRLNDMLMAKMSI